MDETWRWEQHLVPSENCCCHWLLSSMYVDIIDLLVFFVVVAVTPCLYVYQMTRVLISMFTFLKKTNHLNEMTLLPSIRLEEEHLELEELLRPTWTQVELIQWVKRNWLSNAPHRIFKHFRRFMNVELTELVGWIIWFLGVYGAVQSQHIFFRSKNARKNAINF